MHEILNDPIDVTVTFSGHRIFPQMIVWNKKQYKIKRVNLVHSTYEGSKRIFYFSVSDLTNFFKLKLDPDFLEWTLVELYTE